MITFRSFLLMLSLAAVSALSACQDPSSPGSGPDTEEPDPLSGGATTTFDATSNAFSTPAPNLSGDRLDLHLEGDAAFEAAFVSAPAAVLGGLGPVFNNNACVACHPRDGRGRPLESGTTPQSMFLRVSMPGSDPVTGGPAAVPGFGTQLFDKAVFGRAPEGNVSVVWTEMERKFADGERYMLRRPAYSITNTYRALPGNVMTSPRVAPPVFGIGLLEAISESTVLSFADPDDSDGDGISGKPNYVWNYGSGRVELGRFGWKANNPSAVQQTAGAYNGDMGITSPYFPVESSHGNPQSDEIKDDPEIPLETLKATTFYVQTLAVPARRNITDATIRHGEQVFRDANCSGCHIQTVQTGTLEGVPEVSGQTIHPYTDLLLHDMGDELADGRPDYRADGREWRTPPLWGIGLTNVVNGHMFLLHDGRARNLMEAIMWHGGEAAASRDYVRNLPKAEREALIHFLESL